MQVSGIKAFSRLKRLSLSMGMLRPLILAHLANDVGGSSSEPV